MAERNQAKPTESAPASTTGGGGGGLYVVVAILMAVLGVAYVAFGGRTTAPAHVVARQPVHSTAAQFWNVYRYGVVRYLPKRSGDTVERLVLSARELYADDTISSLRSHTGRVLRSLADLQLELEPGFIVCLSDRDRFMWPALKPGEIVRTLASPDQVPGSARELHVRTVSTRPRVFEIPNFLSDAECDHFVDIARQTQLEKSKVGGDTGDKGEYRDVRTSSQTWISPNDPRNSDVVERVRQRVFDLIKMPLDLGEAMQLVHYDVKQHYLGHHDYAHKWESTDNPYVQGGGNRYVTVIYYLNDVEGGGETCFPFGNSTLQPQKQANGDDVIWVNRGNEQIYYGYEGCDGRGLCIPPIKGTAVIFYNLLEEHTWDAVPDSYTLHAGCDVLRGEKFMANQWVRNIRVNGKLYDGNV